MSGCRTYIILTMLVILTGIPGILAAQPEIEEQRSSLHNLPGVAFTVDIEQNTAFADTQLVKIEDIKELGIKQLKEADIRIFNDRAIQESVRTPVLYLHMNLLSTRTGIISFGITAGVYQPVKLALDGDREITGSTWETSVVGIASYDKIGVIKQAATGVIASFIDDYAAANTNKN